MKIKKSSGWVLLILMIIGIINFLVNPFDLNPGINILISAVWIFVGIPVLERMLFDSTKHWIRCQDQNTGKLAKILVENYDQEFLKDTLMHKGFLVITIARLTYEPVKDRVKYIQLHKEGGRMFYRYASKKDKTYEQRKVFFEMASAEFGLERTVELVTKSKFFKEVIGYQKGIMNEKTTPEKLFMQFKMAFYEELDEAKKSV